MSGETNRLCTCCGGALNEGGRCVNVDCRQAAEDATRSAGRETRKATAGAYEPRAFNGGGRVD